jgi:nucleoside-diphosphate-sugar epimerase
MNIETNTEMKRVLVTGAAGFIGHALVQRLLGAGLGGRAVDQVIAVDLKFDGPSADPRVVQIEGSISDAAVRKRALAAPPDTVFHLAALMGSAAERDYELGRRVNLDATLGLIEDLRGSAVPPRFVFASSVGVYGRLPKHADENVLPAPAVTYGAHKLVGEILLADASRRGWVQGCALRLPGVVARPSEGPGMFTAFMSHLFWRLAAGQPITLPVSPSGKVWWISVGACVDNLLHAACVEPGRLNGRRAYQMPALWLSMSEVIDALADRYGSSTRNLVTYAPDPAIAPLFGDSDSSFTTTESEALGFVHDGTPARLVVRAMEN